jgi:UDP-N-acetylmuramyl pentapeptide synthase
VAAVADAEATLAAWRRLRLSGGVVLVKGSRSARMELHVAALSRELGCGPQGGAGA